MFSSPVFYLLYIQSLHMVFILLIFFFQSVYIVWILFIILVFLIWSVRHKVCAMHVCGWLVGNRILPVAIWIYRVSVGIMFGHHWSWLSQIKFYDLTKCVSFLMRVWQLVLSEWWVLIWRTARAGAQTKYTELKLWGFGINLFIYLF